MVCFLERTTHDALHEVRYLLLVDRCWDVKKPPHVPVWPKTFLLDLLDQKYKKQNCAECYADSNGIFIFSKFGQKARNFPEIPKNRVLGDISNFWPNFKKIKMPFELA